MKEPTDGASKKLKVTDEEIIKMLQDFKALNVASITALTGLNKRTVERRMRELLHKKQVYMQIIPAVHTKTHYKIFDGYQGCMMYAVTEEDFKQWILSQIPKNITPLYRTCMTRILNNMGIQMEIPDTNTKKMLWIYNKSLYDRIEERAIDAGHGISREAELLLERGLIETEKEEIIVCALCGKPICRSEKTIGLLIMHYNTKKHQRILNDMKAKK